MKKLKTIASLISVSMVAITVLVVISTNSKANDVQINKEVIKEEAVSVQALTTNNVVTTNSETSNTIKNKMLNSIDYYKDVQGSYKNKTQHRDVTVEFEVDESNDLYSHILIKDKTGIKKNSVADKDSIVDINDKDKSYVKVIKGKIDESKLKNLRENPRVKKNEKGEAVHIFRADPASAQDAEIVTFPQQIAFWLNDDENNYTIVGQEKFLNRESTFIEGTLTSDLSSKFKANKFKMWVDTKTGVLLKLVTLNDMNQETSNIEVINIEFDAGIKNKLKTDVSNEMQDNSLK